MSAARLGGYHAHIVKPIPPFLVAALLAVAPLSLAAQGAPAPPIEVIDAAPDKGFNYPYLLRMPADPSQAAEHETLAFSGLFGSDDTREGLAAFIAKRPAEFKGR